MFSLVLITFADHRATVRVADRLDEPGRAQLCRTIDDAILAGSTSLVVDCSRVVQVQRGALVALAGAKEYLEARGGSLQVRHPSPVFAFATRAEGFADLGGPSPGA